MRTETRQAEAGVNGGNPDGFATLREVRMDRDGLRIAAIEATPYLVVGPCRSASAAIRMTSCGGFTETSIYGPFHFGRATLDYRPAGFEYQEQYGAEGCRFIRIEIAPRSIASLGALFDRPDRPFLLLISQFGELPSRIEQELHARDRFSAVCLKATVLQLVAQASRLVSQTGATAPPRWLIDAQRFMEGNLRAPISLAEVAAAISCDPAWLAKSYKRFFGCTVGDGIRLLRVAEAARLLLMTTLSVARIAAETGFFDASHMTHSFYVVHGSSPTQYRSDNLCAR